MHKVMIMSGLMLLGYLISPIAEAREPGSRWGSTIQRRRVDPLVPPVQTGPPPIRRSASGTNLYGPNYYANIQVDPNSQQVFGEMHIKNYREGHAQVWIDWKNQKARIQFGGQALAVTADGAIATDRLTTGDFQVVPDGVNSDIHETANDVELQSSAITQEQARYLYARLRQVERERQMLSKLRRELQQGILRPQPQDYWAPAEDHPGYEYKYSVPVRIPQ